jgi:hypothetical protein
MGAERIVWQHFQVGKQIRAGLGFKEKFELMFERLRFSDVACQYHDASVQLATELGNGQRGRTAVDLAEP